LSRDHLRGKIAYVMQEDVLMGTMTPREALLFSAALRLPQHVPLDEKAAIVEQMITELGLQRCADSRIGDKMMRGISGGEKKRTSIGVGDACGTCPGTPPLKATRFPRNFFPDCPCTGHRHGHGHGRQQAHSHSHPHSHPHPHAHAHTHTRIRTCTCTCTCTCTRARAHAHAHAHTHAHATSTSTSTCNRRSVLGSR
jgi:hypothetical protein